MLELIFPQISEGFSGSAVAPSDLRSGRKLVFSGGQSFGYYSEIVKENDGWKLRTKVSKVVPPILLSMFLLLFASSALVGGTFALFSVILALVFVCVPRIMCRFIHESHAQRLGLR